MTLVLANACTPPAGTAELTGTSEPASTSGATSMSEPTTSPGTTSAPEPTGGSEGTGTTEPEPTEVTLLGVIQKGPFILGTSVTVAPLDGAGAPTGLQFDTTTTSDLGEFTVASVPVGPVALTADGYYFDEYAGGLSMGPLTLRALHRAGPNAETANLNALTHMSEARGRVLLGQGLTVEDAIAQAESELVTALAIGVPGFTLTGPASAASVTGPDTDDNAYLLAVSAVLATSVHLTVNIGFDAALQGLLNEIAADLAPDGALDPALTDKLAVAETAVDPGYIEYWLPDYLVSLDLDPAIPDMERALDQDHDGLANLQDNCAHHDNPGQVDGDGDGMGDPCDACLTSAEDMDGDGYQDTCDNCPEIANADPPQEEWQFVIYASDSDQDGLGNVCDSCPLSPDAGALPDESCCDPRTKSPCSQTGGQGSQYHVCLPAESGLRFECRLSALCDNVCPACEGPCLPQDACEGIGCLVKWCTTGADTCPNGQFCLEWFKPGEAPAISVDLGICVLEGNNSCTGKVGRECAMWSA